MENSLVSVIIPVYNCEKALDRCIQSVINQSYRELEIILIDDGSTDRSYSIMKKYEQQYSFVHVYHQENLGVSNARNLGIEKSNGDYLYFCDGDDYVVIDAIKTLVSTMINSESDIVVSGYYRVLDAEKNMVQMEKNKFNDEMCTTELIDLILNTTVVAGYLWNKLFKKSLISNTIRFNQKIAIGEDLLFCIEYVTRCNKGKVIDRCLYNYCINNGSVTNSQYSEKNLSYIKALDGVYKILKSREEFLNQYTHVAYLILRLCCSSFFYIKIKRIPNCKYWARYCKNTYKKFSHIYGWNSNWSVKEKTKYVVMKLFV